MLLAYIDEIGETGAFISRDHPKFSTSPAFGYAGFIVPATYARRFGSIFHEHGRNIFATELANAEHPGRWEKKGASMFRPTTPETFPQYIRVFNSLVRTMRRLGGALFYYADEKPLGTPKQTQLDPSARETAAMREALNRIARHADAAEEDVMVVIDQVNEKTRAERLPRMYEHIFGRAAEFPEMRRIVEPPMHVDSVLSSNIQFADWVAAAVSRAIEYQLVKESPYRWIVEKRGLTACRGSFTHESKIHLWRRDLNDLNHSDVFKRDRIVHPTPAGHLLGDDLDPDIVRKIHAAAERQQRRQQS